MISAKTGLNIEGVLEVLEELIRAAVPPPSGDASTPPARALIWSTS